MVNLDKLKHGEQNWNGHMTLSFVVYKRVQIQYTSQFGKATQGLSYYYFLKYDKRDTQEMTVNMSLK